MLRVHKNFPRTRELSDSQNRSESSRIYMMEEIICRSNPETLHSLFRSKSGRLAHQPHRPGEFRNNERVEASVTLKPSFFLSTISDL
jgi:hypothetical protein